MLINLEQAGDLGSRNDDVLLLGKCDDIVKKLAEELGWLKELKAAWAETRSCLDNPPPADEESEEEPEDKAPEAEDTVDEMLHREIAWLTESVDTTLKLTDDLKERVEKLTKDDAAKVVRPVGSEEKEVVGNLGKDGSNL